MHCQSCGGQLGRDCFNPQECAEITADIARQSASSPLTDHAASAAGNDGVCDVDLDALEKVAREISDDDWFVDDDGVGGFNVRTGMDGDVDGDTGQHLVIGGGLIASIPDVGGDYDVANFIATFDPPTVLKLIAAARLSPTPPAPSDRVTGEDVWEVGRGVVSRSRRAVAPTQIELSDIGHGLDYALSDVEVQQVNFSKRQAEVALWAIRQALRRPTSAAAGQVDTPSPPKSAASRLDGSDAGDGA